MQRTFFILFLLLILVNVSFWTIRFQKESVLHLRAASKKEVLKNQSQLYLNDITFTASDQHSFPAHKTIFPNLPFENEDEDKYEVEKESLVSGVYYYINKPTGNNIFSKSSVSSYDRYFFKTHFLDIFSPPPNC